MRVHNTIRVPAAPGIRPFAINRATTNRPSFMWMSPWSTSSESDRGGTTAIDPTHDRTDTTGAASRLATLFVIFSTASTGTTIRDTGLAPGEVTGVAMDMGTTVVIGVGTAGDTGGSSIVVSGRFPGTADCA